MSALLRHIISLITLFSISSLLGSCAVLDWITAEKKTPIHGERHEIVTYLRPDFDPSITTVPGKPENRATYMTPLKVVNSFSFMSISALSMVAPPLITDSGMLVILDCTGVITAFDTKTGARLWSNAYFTKYRDALLIRSYLSGGINISPDSNNIIVSAGVLEVIALSPQDGTLHWQRSFSRPIRSTPIFISDKRIVLQSSDDTLFIVDIGSGEVLQSFIGSEKPMRALLGAHPALVFGGQGVVFQNSYGYVELISLSGDGARAQVRPREELGFLPTSLAPIGYGTVAIDDSRNIAYTLLGHGSIAAIDWAHSGNVAWLKNFRISSAPHLAPDGTRLFAVNDLQQLLAIDANSGDAIWVQDLAQTTLQSSSHLSKVLPQKVGMGWTQPTVVDSTVVTISSDGLAYFFSCEDGKLIEVRKVIHGAYMAPIYRHRHLYVVTDTGNVIQYAIEHTPVS